MKFHKRKSNLLNTPVSSFYSAVADTCEIHSLKFTESKTGLVQNFFSLAVFTYRFVKEKFMQITDVVLQDTDEHRSFYHSDLGFSYAYALCHLCDVNQIEVFEVRYRFGSWFAY